MACKCGNEKCKGFILLHPAEVCKVPELKARELKNNENCTFNLIDSPSSGEIFTKFKELHVIGSILEDAMTLEIGDEVVMNNVYYVSEENKGKVYKVRSVPWKIGEKDCVLLEGYRGGYAVDGLTKVKK